MSEIDDIVLRRFHALYGAPETSNAQLFAEEYRNALAGTDRDILREAVDRLVKAHSFRTWPTIGEVRRLIDVVALERFNRNRRGHVPENHPQPTPEQRARVAALVASMAKNMAEKQKKRGGKPILDALYEEIHGEPWPSRKAIEAMKVRTGR